MTTGEGGEFSHTPTEIERKWIVDSRTLPADIYQCPHASIKQGYLVVDPEGNETRVRNKAGSYTLTVKSKGGLVRGEWETPIDSEQFERLWPASEGKRIEKVRYAVPYGDHVIELDIYEGNLSGLVVAEIEFDSEAGALEFQGPAWLAADVTEDSRFKNQNLAVYGIDTN